MGVGCRQRPASILARSALRSAFCCAVRREGACALSASGFEWPRPVPGVNAGCWIVVFFSLWYYTRQGLSHIAHTHACTNACTRTHTNTRKTCKHTYVRVHAHAHAHANVHTLPWLHSVVDAEEVRCELGEVPSGAQVAPVRLPVPLGAHRLSGRSLCQGQPATMRVSQRARHDMRRASEGIREAHACACALYRPQQSSSRAL